MRIKDGWKIERNDLRELKRTISNFCGTRRIIKKDVEGITDDYVRTKRAEIGIIKAKLIGMGR